MKKFFIFLFSVFLITFMGCSPATGEIPETPTSETTEETIEDTTEEIPETFEVFALDDTYSILNEIDIEQINTDFSYGYFYRNIKVNSIIYTVNFINNVKGLLIEDYYNEYYFTDTISNSIDFRDFYKGEPIRFENKDVVIYFSDLYEEVVQ